MIMMQKITSRTSSSVRFEGITVRSYSHCLENLMHYNPKAITKYNYYQLLGRSIFYEVVVRPSNRIYRINPTGTRELLPY